MNLLHTLVRGRKAVHVHPGENQFHILLQSQMLSAGITVSIGISYTKMIFRQYVTFLHCYSLRTVVLPDLGATLNVTAVNNIMIEVYKPYLPSSKPNGLEPSGLFSCVEQHSRIP